MKRISQEVMRSICRFEFHPVTAFANDARFYGTHDQVPFPRPCSIGLQVERKNRHIPQSIAFGKRCRQRTPTSGQSSTDVHFIGACSDVREPFLAESTLRAIGRPSDRRSFRIRNTTAWECRPPRREHLQPELRVGAPSLTTIGIRKRV